MDHAGGIGLHDEAWYADLTLRHRPGLHRHCYRMVGSLDDAEDLVQETLLRAWRSRGTFAGRSSVGSWLYRIATNVCLDFLQGRPRRLLARDVVGPSDPSREPPDPVDLPWLDPYPGQDRGLAAPTDERPDEVLVDKETIELAFLAAIQHLAPRSRAALVLRDVVGWSAKDTAAALGLSVVATNSALQRAREKLATLLPADRLDWRTPAPSPAERRILDRYMEAHERGDVAALGRLLREDVRVAAVPRPLRFDGRDHYLASARRAATPGRYVALPTMANGQLAAAIYAADGPAGFAAFALDVLTVRDGAIVEIATFLRADLFERFGLPPHLAAGEHAAARRRGLVLLRTAG